MTKGDHAVVQLINLKQLKYQLNTPWNWPDTGLMHELLEYIHTLCMTLIQVMKYIRYGTSWLHINACWNIHKAQNINKTTHIYYYAFVKKKKKERKKTHTTHTQTCHIHTRNNHISWLTFKMGKVVIVFFSLSLSLKSVSLKVGQVTVPSMNR